MSQFSSILAGGASERTVIHLLGTITPDIRVFRRGIGAEWLLIQPTEYAAAVPDLAGAPDPDRVTLRFPFVIDADTLKAVVSNEAPLPVTAPPNFGAPGGGSQLADFLGMMQGGQEMSLQSLWPVTLIFPGQGNASGYAASGGPRTEGMGLQFDGTLLADHKRSFRVNASMLAGDGVVIVAEKTHVKADGVTYRVESVGSIPVDGCLHLGCKQL